MPQSNAPRLRLRLLRHGAFLLGFSGLLLLGLAHGSIWLASPPWDGPATGLNRLAQIAALPGYALIGLVARPAGHAWAWGALVAVSLLTPILYDSLWLLFRWWIRRRPPAVQAGDLPAASCMDRRRFLIRSATGAAGLTTAGCGAWAVGIEPGRLQLRRYAIPIRDLPPALDGLRLVQVSDTHLGPFISRGYLEAAMRQVNALAPDLIVLTGDYVHRTPLSIRPGIELLAPLRARLGRVAVLGNHDHWEGAAACRSMFQTIGLPLIDNDRLFLTPAGLTPDLPAFGEGICLAGLGDLWSDSVQPDRAFRDTPEAMPRILLSHNPDAAEELGNDYRIDLMLAGHTHGGQVRLPLLGAPIVPSAFGQRYAGGVCAGPAGPVVVSRGIGMAVLPVRWGVPPELVEITLRRAAG